MNAFINALKQKAAVTQASIKKTPVKPKITPPSANLLTILGINTSNTDLQDYYNDSASIKNVERVLNRNRLDIYFDKCPNHEQREALKKHSFRYNPDTKAWYNKDSKESCNFIIGYFGVDLDYPTPDQPQIQVIDEATSENTPITQIQPIKQETEKPDYITYKKQISELLQALNCDFADLPLIAVDCLYKKTFN